MIRSHTLPALFGILIAVQPVFGVETANSSDAEQQIRSALKTYVEAFNRGEAVAVAAFWSDKGQYTAPNGEKVTGREAIQEAFAELFAKNKGLQLEIETPSIRFVGPDVAIEEGVAAVTREGDAPQWKQYAATHVRERGAWKIKGVREIETRVAPSHYEQLKDLGWLAGDWVDQNENAAVRTTVRLSRNGNFLTRSFAADINGQIDLEGIQIIGFDPSRGKIRSWLFDSDGGIGEGVWTRDGNRWTVQGTQVLPDGRKGSQTRVITYVDDDTFTLNIAGREVDGESLPDVEEVKIVRQK